MYYVYALYACIACICRIAGIKGTMLSRDSREYKVYSLPAYTCIASLYSHSLIIRSILTYYAIHSTLWGQGGDAT